MVRVALQRGQGRHIRLLCQTRHKNLAAFMGYVKARITDTINLLSGKRGPLWARRYDAEPVLDDGACADRVGMAPELYRQGLRGWMQQSLDKVRARKRSEHPARVSSATPARVLGVDAVVEAAFETRPRSPASRPRPHAHGHIDRVREHNRAMLLVIDDYGARAKALPRR